MELTLAKSKSGVFFTLAGILLIAFILSFITIQLSTISFTTTSDTNRLIVVDEFLNSVYIDSSFALETVSLRGFLAMGDYISEYGLYIDDMQLRLHEAIINETVHNNSYTVLENNSMSYWAENIAQFAQTFSIQADITFGDLEVTQTDPWYVTVQYEIHIDIKDLISLAEWNESRNITAQVPIEGIYDPLYIVETSNKFSIPFQKSPYTHFVSGTNITNLSNHISGQYYSQFDDAPNFLNRFTGNNAASGASGIESLIDKDTMSVFTPVDFDASSADYVYFSSNNETVYSFVPTPAYFKLDNITSGSLSHHSKYNVENLVS